MSDLPGNIVPASPVRTPRTERDLIVQAMEQAHTPGSGGFSFPADLPPPGTFPGYELIREVHRGGQGAVYLAVQLATKRRVAIKLMHGGPFRGSAGKARFEREVQILGQLNHPNIVRIHDSGSALDGSNFYVMDYVSGRSLDEVISSDRRPPVDETLRLFLKICDGINAAHLKGIIHRDIKPSNIRISTSGEPVVVDFGLAKVALPGGSSDATPPIMSMTGQFIGSLPWASPEQAEGVHDNVDVRTDVYSLGVVLYQLLTGKFPYDVVGNMRDVLDRILRAVPARPSTVRRQINDEVETIVLKCLSKERERRYQSAGELARDIERYLDGQPIEAKRDSIFYVVTKTARRFWIPATVLGTAVVALVVFGAVMSVLYRDKSRAQAELAAALAETTRLKERAESDLEEIKRAREAERRERRRAEMAIEAAVAPAHRMIFEFDPALKNLVGATPQRVAFLEYGKKYLTTLRENVGDDRRVLREIAAVHQRLGEMTAEIFEKRVTGTDEGLENLAEAMRIRERLAAEQPDDIGAKIDLARSIRSAAANLRMEQKAADAKAQYDRAVALLDECLAKLPADSPLREEALAERADCIVGQAYSLARLTTMAPDADSAASLQSESEGRYAAAEEYWRERLRANPDDARAARQAFLARDGLIEHLVSTVAPGYRREKKYDRALAVLDRVDSLASRAIAELEVRGNERPQDRTLKRNLEVALHWAGWSQQERAACLAQRAEDEKLAAPPEAQAAVDRGLELFKRSYEIAAALEASDIDDLEAKRDLSLLYNKLGNMYRELGRKDPLRLADARQFYERSLAIRRNLMKSDPINRHRNDLLVGLTKLGNALKALAETAPDAPAKRPLLTEARDLNTEALREFRELVAAGVRANDPRLVGQIEAQIRECDAEIAKIEDQ
ncbi:MAG: hypothetical protein AMXMBFR58_30000 [Phycisphaerae bacterium]